MATERLAMHDVREILRQKLTLKQSHREVMAALGVSMGVVSGRTSAFGQDAEKSWMCTPRFLKDSRSHQLRCRARSAGALSTTCHEAWPALLGRRPRWPVKQM